jgi:hypothetical protein
MKMSEMFPSPYIKAADLRGRHELTIKAVAIEEIGDDRKPTLAFNETAKRFVLNRTNGGVIGEAYGEETDRWVGKKITLYKARVQYQGRLVDGIRVEVSTPTLARNEPPQFGPGDDEMPF